MAVHTCLLPVADPECRAAVELFAEWVSRHTAIEVAIRPEHEGMDFEIAGEPAEERIAVEWRIRGPDAAAADEEGEEWAGEESMPGAVAHYERTLAALARNPNAAARMLRETGSTTGGRHRNPVSGRQ